VQHGPPSFGEPRVVRERHQDLRAAPHRLAGEPRRNGVVADQWTDAQPPAVAQWELDDGRPGSGLPPAEPRERRAHRARLEDRRQLLGQRKERRLAIRVEADARPLAGRAGLRRHEHRGVELVGAVDVVGAERERRTGLEHERRDLAVEGRAGVALRRAERRRVDRLRPRDEVERAARERIRRQREVCVEDRADRVVGAELGAQSAVAADVGLDQRGAQRRRAGGAVLDLAEAERSVGGEGERERGARRARAEGERPRAAARCARRGGDALVAEHHREREPGRAGEVARLAQRARDHEAVPERVGEELRREPFDRDVGRRARERERGAAHAASREQRSRDAPPDELRLQHRREHDERCDATPRRHRGVRRDAEPEPPEDRRGEHDREREARGGDPAEPALAVEPREPRHEREPREPGRPPAELRVGGEQRRRRPDRKKCVDQRAPSCADAGTSSMWIGRFGGASSGGTMRSGGSSMRWPASSIHS
jgi:hypothetical protein